MSIKEDDTTSITMSELLIMGIPRESIINHYARLGKERHIDADGATSITMSELLVMGMSRESIIEHYGRLGQKWGVRRSKKQLAAGSKTKKTLISDEELQKRVTRLKLEQEFHKLSGAKAERNRTSGSKAASFVGKSVGTMVVSAGSKQLGIVINEEMAKAVSSARSTT